MLTECVNVMIRQTFLHLVEHPKTICDDGNPNTFESYNGDTGIVSQSTVLLLSILYPCQNGGKCADGVKRFVHLRLGCHFPVTAWFLLLVQSVMMSPIVLIFDRFACKVGWAHLELTWW